MSDIFFSLGVASAVSILTLEFCIWAARKGGTGNRWALWTVAPRIVALAAILSWVRPSYEGRMGSDADVYYQLAVNDSALMTAGQWGAIPMQPGVDLTGLLAGLIYHVTGASMTAMYVISAALGWCGGVFFYFGFAEWAKPKGLYASLILMLPSVQLWSSIFGKDSVSFLCLGAAFYIYSRVSNLGLRGPAPWLKMSFALGGLCAMRPHIATLVVLALGAGQVRSLVSAKNRKARFRALMPMVGLALAGAVSYYCASTLVAGMGDTVSQRMLKTSTYSAVGESATEIAPVSSWGELAGSVPAGILRTLCRPWPWEAHNTFAVLASLENAACLVIFLIYSRRLLNNFWCALRTPFGIFCAVAAMLFLMVDSQVANLGMTSRAKAHVLPFLGALLLYKQTRRAASGRTAGGGILWLRRPLAAPGAALQADFSGRGR